jgi:hypothetical protein
MIVRVAQGDDQERTPLRYGRPTVYLRLLIASFVLGAALPVATVVLLFLHHPMPWPLLIVGIFLMNGVLRRMECRADGESIPLSPAAELATVLQALKRRVGSRESGCDRDRAA